MTKVVELNRIQFVTHADGMEDKKGTWYSAQIRTKTFTKIIKSTSYKTWDSHSTEGNTKRLR